MTQTHLAELNIGRLLAPPGDPRVQDFMDNLDRINGLGKRMPGFVWILEGAGQGATEFAIQGDALLVPNLTVWETLSALRTFVYDTLHARFMDRRSEWFEVLEARHFVMWHVPAGHIPTLDEALARLDHLRTHGDSPTAFGWDYAKAHNIA